MKLTDDVLLHEVPYPFEVQNASHHRTFAVRLLVLAWFPESADPVPHL